MSFIFMMENSQKMQSKQITQPQSYKMNFVNHTKLLFDSMFKYKRKFKLIYENYIQNRSFQKNHTEHLNVLFFGTDKFSLPSLKALVGEQKCHRTVGKLGVVTSFKSSSNPVKKYATANNLECFDWPISQDVCKVYHLGVVVSFGHLIPESIISSLPFGMINVHASLLPRWRGAAPIIYAIMKGDKKTGVSIMKILPKHFDIGEILAQKEIEIIDDCLMPQLHETLSNEGAHLLVDCLQNLDSRLEFAQQQNPDLVSYAPKVTSALAQVNWNATAMEVYNLYRALYSFKPLITMWNNLQVKIIELKLSKSDVVKIEPPGTVEYIKLDKCIRIFCGNGSSVCVYKLALEGKKTMSAVDFYNGFLTKCKDKNYFT